jgi:hypothetical protein
VTVVQCGRDVTYGVAVDEIADDELGASVDEPCECCRAVGVPGVHHHVVSRSEQGLRREPSEAVGGAGDEDPCQRDRSTADPVPAWVVECVAAQEARSLSRSSESVPGSAEYTVRARVRSRWAETSIVR